MSLMLMAYGASGVRASASSGWDRPNLGTALGPGEFAPDWSGKTAYGEEVFDEPLPIGATSASNNARGFRMTSAAGTGEQQRYDYPTIATPLGVKPVLRIIYPGSTNTINADGQATAPRMADRDWSVMVRGTWSGTLQFEKSDNGGSSWESIELFGARAGGGPFSEGGTSTTVNGVWTGELGLLAVGRTFRVRASSWTSGTATVYVGMKGGAGPTQGFMGDFSGDPTRIYTRFLIRWSPNWTHNENVSTKLLFFSRDAGNNHVVNMPASTPDDQTMQAQCIPQGAPGTQFASGILGGPATEWCDVEWEFQSGTAGNFDSIARCWVNGVQLLDVDNLRFFASATTPRFTSLFIDPTYGGGNAPPPANIYWEVAAWYRESAP